MCVYIEGKHSLVKKILKMSKLVQQKEEKMWLLGKLRVSVKFMLNPFVTGNLKMSKFFENLYFFYHFSFINLYFVKEQQ